MKRIPMMTAAALVAMLAAGMAQTARAVQATGGTVTNYTLNGSNFEAHIFTTVGTSNFVVASGGNVEVLVVAGGGGGATAGDRTGGGGGAGGLLYTSSCPITAGTYVVTVGAGGAKDSNGSTSSFSTVLSATGGGKGGNNGQAGGNGGSGGGKYHNASGVAGTGIAGQGHNGGTPGYDGGAGGPFCGAGGGGASTTGMPGTVSGSGAGGAGLAYDLRGTSVYYAGGGGGGVQTTTASLLPAGAGGIGGGGMGASSWTGGSGVAGANATANSGGGGGGGGTGGAGGAGGSGIVIVRWLLATSGLPQITDVGPQNVSNTSADVVGTLVTNGAATATVSLYWSTTDGTTNASTWTVGGGSVSNLGSSFANGATFTNTLLGLAPDTTYFWNYCASNSNGTAWAALFGSPSFKTYGPLGVNNDGGAGSIGPYSATLRGTLTNGVSASATVYCGTDTNNWTYTNALGTVTEAQGVFSTNQTGLARNTLYYYTIVVSNQYGTAQSPVTNFTTLPYVWITANTTCFENQTNQWAGAPVVVDGAGVVLTLSNSATYGNLPVYAFGNLIVTNNASVVCLSQGSMSPYTITNRGVAIRSAGDVIVAGGSSINADGTGFLASTGPGGSSSGGGTYGGRCPNNAKATYGSAMNPVCLGSGGSGGNGGGAIELIVNGNLIVNGRLSANGSDYAYGAGAGGSIWITGGCAVGGTGEIQVSGGSSANGLSYANGGGGGRLSIDDTVNYGFHGNIKGANNNQINCYGGAGSIYFGAQARQNFTVFSNQTLVIGNDIAYVFGNLTVYGTLVSGGSYAGQGSGVVIRAANLTIAASGSISADSWGLYPGPAWLSGAGGTHAGAGESNTNASYGSATAPTSMGSGGGGNYGAVGGGAVELIVSGTLNVLGSISANAPQGGYTGGAGGGIWIDTGTLSGNGSIRANGADSNQGTYRGGGGRIAVYYHSASTFTGLPAAGLYTNLQSISSTVTVKGGYNTSANGPEDGSIYIAHVVPMGMTVFFR